MNLRQGPKLRHSLKHCVSVSNSLLAKFSYRKSIPRPKIGLSDTAVMDMMISNLQQQRQVTEQLRREAAVKRISVSLAVQDIIKFISEHEQEDCLLVGFSSQKANPFREKSSCNLF